MIFQPRIFPISFSGNPQSARLENSNLVLLPPEILAQDCSTNIQNNETLFFELKHNNSSINVGVFEFTDFPDICYIPYYYMVLLGIKEGDRIDISQIPEPHSATHIILTPHEQAFSDLQDPKGVLEECISKNYPILSETSIIRVETEGKIFSLSVSKLEPNGIAKMIDCDVNLEFSRALDYEQNVEIETLDSQNVNREINETGSNYNFTPDLIRNERQNNIPFIAFGGIGYKLGS